MSTPENFTPRNIERAKERTKGEVLRGRKLRALATGTFLTIGGLVGLGANKYVEREHVEKEAAMATMDVKDMDDYQLSVYFKSNVEDAAKAHEAAKIILTEIKNNPEYKNGIALNSGVNVFGGNSRLDMARDNLTKIIRSRSASRPKFDGKVLWATKYTTEVLDLVLSDTTKK